MISDNARSGMQQAPARSLFNALGFTAEEMKKPMIGAATFALAALKDLSFSVLVILIKTYAVFKHLFRFFVKEDLVRTKRL